MRFLAANASGLAERTSHGICNGISDAAGSGKVSDDILVRLALRKLHPNQQLGDRRSLFMAKILDPRITRHTFIADLLLEHAGDRDFPPVAGGLLDADTVWSILLAERLGLCSAHPD